MENSLDREKMQKLTIHNHEQIIRSHPIIRADCEFSYMWQRKGKKRKGKKRKGKKRKEKKRKEKKRKEKKRNRNRK